MEIKVGDRVVHVSADCIGTVIAINPKNDIGMTPVNVQRDNGAMTSAWIENLVPELTVGTTFTLKTSGPNARFIIVDSLRDRNYRAVLVNSKSSIIEHIHILDIDYDSVGKFTSPAVTKIDLVNDKIRAITYVKNHFVEVFGAAPGLKESKDLVDKLAAQVIAKRAQAKRIDEAKAAYKAMSYEQRGAFDSWAKNFIDDED